MEQSRVVSKKRPQQKHILIVDDEERFRGALSQTLILEGFQITQVGHGKSALEIIALQDVDAIVSDINMPGMTGIELMRQVLEIKPSLPVILMTGFAELKETKEAFDLGARGFLPKPFRKEELLKVLDEWLIPAGKGQKTGDAEAGESEDLKYCKLSIDDFTSGNEIRFDIYIRLSAQKFLKIAHQGESLPIERIQAYKLKDINHLYLTKEDFKRYMGFNLNLLPLVSAKETISKERKIAFLKHTSDVILEHLHLNGVDHEGFENAKAVVESTISLMTEPDEMAGLLTRLNSHADYLYSHCLGVSTYSVMIARELGWTSPANLYKVAMGGLLHDIGKKEIDREILRKRRHEWSAEEVRIYETHPQRGMELLSLIPSIPGDVLIIALQHHENCFGLGFPMRLAKSHIHPMARLVSVADEFCNLVIKGPNSLMLGPIEAIQRMATLQPDKFDSQFLAALMRVFKVPGAKRKGGFE
jgi:putative nucleotidyltransferase with HDIG domain